MAARSRFADRIDDLAEAASDERATLDPDPPDDDRATEIARDGVGPTVALYCEARTGGKMIAFDEREFDRLQAALNDWLWCYAACYGVEFDRDATIREAAELLIDTRDARDVATVLTGVPGR
ncbi:MAG: hypothetical protein ABEJ89_08950 [Haloarculaceae archaeon]